MREDACGLFWDDTPPPKAPKDEKPKCTPPPVTWGGKDYLPHFEEACRFPVSLFTDEELREAQARGEILIFDSEIYHNYYLAAFTSLESGKVFFTENKLGGRLDWERLLWIINNFQIVTFNGNYFDMPLLALAIDGLDTDQLKKVTNQMILEGEKPWRILRSHKVKPLECNHIDLIEVAPLQASLKIYGGRLHAPRMQELPYPHDSILTDDQIKVVRWYCIGSDLVNTAFVFMELRSQIDLRSKMSGMYGVDLRSKSDAQIAEAVIVHELARENNGLRPQRPELPPGMSFAYRVPDFIKYKTDDLRYVLEVVRTSLFQIEENGSPKLPQAIGELLIPINGKFYQMGIGGLHSNETKAIHEVDDSTLLIDRDVTSYYPSIILNQGLFPQHLGPSFLRVYRSLVERRILAKKEGRKVEADTLKIVVNGSFGKLGSKWSCLYAPDLMVQVTITGQLSLLMLIEKLELAGIPVVSANTDGILIKCPKRDEALMNSCIGEWERETNFMTEETPYQAFYARDVNNYIGIKKDGKVKLKGTYAEKGSAGDSVLSKNPQSLICNDALIAFFKAGTPLARTILGCRDIRRFITVRTVKGGAVKDGQYLGKAIRWYYAKECPGEIIYASNGHKVPDSEGARPCMELPPGIPADLDFDRYLSDAQVMLFEIGYLREDPRIT